MQLNIILIFALSLIKSITKYLNYMEKPTNKRLVAKQSAPHFNESNNDDLRALKAIKAGDSKAFAQIVEKYHAHLFRRIFLAVHSKEIAQDILQEIYIKVYQGMDTYKKQFTFNAWITRVASNYLVDYFRQQNKDINRHMLSMDAIMTNSDGDQTRFEVEDKSARFDEENYEATVSDSFSKTLDLMNNHLKEKDKKILQLYYLEGKRQREVAIIIGIKHTTVRGRIHKLTTKLKLQKIAAKKNVKIQMI